MSDRKVSNIENWMEETSKPKVIVIFSLLVIILSGFLFWYWDWANLSVDGMTSAFMLNIFAFFFIFIPLGWIWKKIKSK
tara:strand:+ start:301 stop:537 length:237 start_codon:yes stop_codon:yes gene_type:complete